MNMGAKQTFVASMLILSMVDVFAQGAANHSRTVQHYGTAAFFYTQKSGTEKIEPGMDQMQRDTPQRDQERRRSRDAGLPDSSGSGDPADNQANAASDANRRQGKLSVEERRALRRQIDEAGHDIYAPKR
jgi:hypothetical protein